VTGRLAASQYDQQSLKLSMYNAQMQLAMENVELKLYTNWPNITNT